MKNEVKNDFLYIKGGEQGMNGKTIVILGGGVGGIVAANELRQRLSRNHRIVLVEKNSEHAFAPSFLWLIIGYRQPDGITRPISSLIRSGVELVQAEVEKIDISARLVSTSKGQLTYDYLVIALGAELVPETIPGLSQAAYSFYSFEEAKRLKEALAQFNGGKIAIVVSSVPYKCPAAPPESAILIADYLWRNLGRGKFSISLYTPEPQPMPVAGPQMGEAVKQILASMSISFHPLHKLKEVDVKNKHLLFDGIEAVPYDLLIAVPPHRAPRVVIESGLTDETGWIPVDRNTLKTKFENVYAIGDVTSITIPGRWKPDVPLKLPKAGVFAHFQAETVAERIADEINGRMPTAQFLGKGYCALEMGGGVAALAYGDFFGEPSPKVQMRNPSKFWHIGKVLFERWWLSPFGVKRSLLRSMINIGNQFMKVPLKI